MGMVKWMRVCDQVSVFVPEQPSYTTSGALYSVPGLPYAWLSRDSQVLPGVGRGCCARCRYVLAHLREK